MVTAYLGASIREATRGGLQVATIIATFAACGLRTPLDSPGSVDAQPAYDLVPLPDLANSPDLSQDRRPQVPSDASLLTDVSLARDGRDGNLPDAVDRRDVLPSRDLRNPDGYPVAKPGHGLADILPMIVESPECLKCVAEMCPAAITCANEALCATQVSCLVSICRTDSVLVVPPPMCVPNLASRCEGFTDLKNCPTSSCSLPSLSAAHAGLQGAACVYELCHPFCFRPD